MNEVELYIEQQEPRVRELLMQVREIVLELIPNGVEAISYQIPCIRLNPTTKRKNNVLHYAGFKDHISLFPRSNLIDERMGSQILSFCSGKATLEFKLDQPLPIDIVRQFVQLRLEEHLTK